MSDPTFFWAKRLHAGDWWLVRMRNDAPDYAFRHDRASFKATVEDFTEWRPLNPKNLPPTEKKP